MHKETPNESALELRLKQVIRYVSLALVAILALCFLLFMYVGSVKQSEAVAQNNQQAQAQLTIDSNVCKVYPDQDLCIMAHKIAENPDQAIIPKDGLNGKDGSNGKNGADGSNGVDGRGVKSFEQKSGILTVTYTDGQTQDLGKVVGETGATGAAGAAGKNGTNGANGTNGTNGRGIVSSDISSGHLMVTYTDGTVQDVGMVVGPKGDTGEKGDKGDTGDAGAPGLTPTRIDTDASGNVTITYSDGSTSTAGQIIGPVLAPLSCVDGQLTVTLSNGSSQSVAADCTPDNAQGIPGVGK